VKKYGTARQATDDNIVRRMRFAFWENKATNTNQKNAEIIALRWQQWLRERVLYLLYNAYVAWLVIFQNMCQPRDGKPQS